LRKKGYLKKGKGDGGKGKNKIWCQNLLQMIFGRFLKKRASSWKEKKSTKKAAPF